ncbi:MAG TPA: hypothetical protein VFJ24_11415 [Gaiellales bacterium]|nr:hypothetical protein [Gaiellales bacterium]
MDRASALCGDRVAPDREWLRRRQWLRRWRRAKTTCEKANKVQRLADLRSAGDLKAIGDLGEAATEAAKGAKKGSAAARDLNSVADAAGNLHEDVATDQSQVPTDIASLRNWLDRLARDCSKVLTG